LGNLPFALQSDIFGSEDESWSYAPDYDYVPEKWLDKKIQKGFWLHIHYEEPGFHIEIARAEASHNLR
jgi:hypothetical protein